MSIHNFKRLIKKYTTGTTIAVKETEGYYDMENGGVWVDGEKESIVLDPVAIVPLSKDDLKFDGGGTYSDDNRKLYCYEKLEKGTIIINTQYNNVTKTYKILSDKDYSDFDTGLYIYILERGGRDDKETS